MNRDGVEAEEENVPEDEEISRTVLIALAAGSPLILVLLAIATVVLLKALRRRRRRRRGTGSVRVAGGWAELPDDAAVADYWQAVQSTEGRLRQAVGRRRWLRSRISATSLRKAR